MRVMSAITCLLLVSGTLAATVADQQTVTRPQSAPPPDAARVRAEIRAVEVLLPKLPDRGAALFWLARRYAHLGEREKALALLKDCIALDAGFVPDPDKSPSLKSLKESEEFRDLLEQARRRYPSVSHASVAFTVPDRDLFPEGLAVDASMGIFYMGSMHRKKIVKFTLGGGVSDFVKEGAYDLSPVGGVHVDPGDHTVWAATDAGEKQRPELLHFDAQGKLRERYPSPGEMPHDLNDLVLRGWRPAAGAARPAKSNRTPRALRGAATIFMTDTEGNHVYRFDRASHKFTEMRLWRPVFEPNGITLSGDENVLFVADIFGVIRVDLRTGESSDVDPGPRNTLCGIDGLYWYEGGLLGVEYGTGEYRVMHWKLSRDGRKVVSSETLEYGTGLVSDPTTGAIYGDKFYFIANTGIYNLENDQIIDPTKLEPVHIAAVPLR